MTKLPRIPKTIVRTTLACLAASLMVVPTGARNQTNTVLSNLMPGQLGEMQAQLLRAEASLQQLQNVLSVKEAELQQARQREISAHQVALEAEQHTVRLQSEMQTAVGEQSSRALPEAARNEAVAVSVRDLSELRVQGCAEDCPSFVVIPQTGPVTLGAGEEAMQAEVRHRFAMARTEVTVAQWRAFWTAPDRAYQPIPTPGATCHWSDTELTQDENAPVRCISATDAEAYGRWFAKRYTARMGVRVQGVGLPTEVEWELSARGGRYTEAYLWDEKTEKTEWCRQAQFGKCSGSVTAVASRRPNGYGLYDMIGNVAEWQASPWRELRSAIPADGKEPKAGAAVRAVRGASYSTFIEDRLTLAHRQSAAAAQRNPHTGFRLVLRLS